MSTGPGYDETLYGPEGSLEEAVPRSEEAGSDATTAGEYEVNGEKYTAEDLAEAIQAWKNRQSWEKSLKAKDQQYAGIRTALEMGFGRKIAEFTPQDLDDIRAFGILNARLRSDPAFAKAWEESLVQAYRRMGMGSADARQQAKQDVADAKQSQAQLPPEVLERLGRVDMLERMMLEQGLSQFEAVLERDVQGAIEKYAKDLAPQSRMLRTMILHGIVHYDDDELLERYKSGELQREISEIAKQAAKEVRAWLGQKAVAAGDAVRAARAGVGPKPTGGEAAASVNTVEAKPGSGLKHMANRMLRELSGSA